MKWFKYFAISFSLIFVFALFGVLSFSSMDRSSAKYVNFDKGATIVVPIYEVTMDPIVISAVPIDNAQCSNKWLEPVESECCV